jgi:hypothetical protein
MKCLMPPLELVSIGKWFAFVAPSRLKFLGLDSRTNFRVFSHGNSHLVRNLKVCS